MLAHETHADAEESARHLKSLGPHAWKLLSECVEQQEVCRRHVSKAAQALSDAGFVFVRGTGDLWHDEFTLTPSFLGEEALECLETLQAWSAGT